MTCADGVLLIDDADGVVGGGEQHGTDAPALRRHPFIGGLEGVSVQRLVAGHAHGDDAGALVDVVHEAGVVGRGDEEHVARLGQQGGQRFQRHGAAGAGGHIVLGQHHVAVRAEDHLLPVGGDGGAELVAALELVVVQVVAGEIHAVGCFAQQVADLPVYKVTLCRAHVDKAAGIGVLVVHVVEVVKMRFYQRGQGAHPFLAPFGQIHKHGAPRSVVL